MATLTDLRRTYVETMRGLLAGSAQTEKDSWNADAIVRRTIQHTVLIPKTAADANANANYTYYWWTAPTNMTVKEASFLPQGALTLNAANYAEVKLGKADGAAGNITVLAVANTSATNMANGVKFPLAVQSTDTVTDGEVLALVITKQGSGESTVPIGGLTVHLEER